MPEKTAAAPLLRLNNVAFSYSNKPLLRDVSFELRGGDFLTVIGPNASGKSTLARLILGLLRPTAGTVELNGAPPAGQRSLLSYVPQQMLFDRAYPISAEQVVAMGMLRPRFRLTPARGDRQKIISALRRVGAEHTAEQPFHKLSGGTRQRVLIARALVSQPRLLIMDEATAAIDAASQTAIIDLCHQLRQQSAILFITHNLSLLPAIGDRLLCINDGTAHQHSTANINRTELLQLLSSRGHIR